MSLIANGLIVLENAFLDDREFGGQHAIVVILHGGEAAVDGAVAEDVHQFAAETKLAHLLSRKKAGAREIGFVTQRAIQFGGVPDGLVNRQPQMAGHQHQILLAGLDRRRGQVLQHLGADTRSVLCSGWLWRSLPSRPSAAPPCNSACAKCRSEIDGDSVQHGDSLRTMYCWMDEPSDGSEVLVFGLEAQSAE